MSPATVSYTHLSSEPLIVVDGSPFDGDLSMINSQDVESMTVLKDAAANALYGDVYKRQLIYSKYCYSVLRKELIFSFKLRISVIL